MTNSKKEKKGIKWRKFSLGEPQIDKMMFINHSKELTRRMRNFWGKWVNSGMLEEK